MIGTPVRGTIWYCDWTYLDPEKPSTPVQGGGYILTADPSGADLYEVTRSVVLNGRATDAHQFSLVHTKRCPEAKGTAIAGGGNGGN